MEVHQFILTFVNPKENIWGSSWRVNTGRRTEMEHMLKMLKMRRAKNLLERSSLEKSLRTYSRSSPGKLRLLDPVSLTPGECPNDETRHLLVDVTTGETSQHDKCDLTGPS